MSNFFYNKRLKPLARANRGQMTKAEASLWKYLLARRQMSGYQFRRQRPISGYIVDFVCLPLKLIIEVDGMGHENLKQIEKDSIRERELESLGFTILRFTNWEVLNRIEDVSIHISKWIEANATVPPPNPRQRGKHKDYQ